MEDDVHRHRRKGEKKGREREAVVGAWPKFVWRREGWRRWSRADQLSLRWSPVCSQLQPGYQLLELFGIGASIQHPQGGEEWKQSISKWDHLGHLNNCAHIINILSPALFMKSMGVAAFNLRKWGRWRKGGGVTALWVFLALTILVKIDLWHNSLMCPHVQVTWIRTFLASWGKLFFSFNKTSYNSKSYRFKKKEKSVIKAELKTSDRFANLCSSCEKVKKTSTSSAY